MKAKVALTTLAVFVVSAIAILAVAYVGTQDELERVQQRFSSLQTELLATKAAALSRQAALVRTKRKLREARKQAAYFRTPFLGGPQPEPNGRGAFTYCPDLAGTLAVPSADRDAERAALRFERALHRGDIFAMSRLVDPTVRVVNPGYWASTTGVRPFSVNAFPGWGAGKGIVRYACGDDVARRTVSVVVFDSGDSASGQAVTYYLLHRPSGWKIWGSY